MNLEELIFSNLLSSGEYSQQVLPHLKKDYFTTNVDKEIFDVISNYTENYNSAPSKEAVLIDLENCGKLSDDDYLKAKGIVKKLGTTTEKIDWLVDQTEKWCKDRAIFNAIQEAIVLLDGETSQRGAIPELLSSALSVSFDDSIGHDFVGDAEERHKFYHTKEVKIPFNLKYLDKITKGGLPRKTLNIILAGCVHPDTPVKIKTGDYERDVTIKEVKYLLERGLVQVWSADGWVKVNEFISKGNFPEYILKTENGLEVSCNADHLFNTTFGWMSAQELLDLQETYSSQIHIHTIDGLSKGEVFFTGRMIPIVDINVESENSRYYTNGIDSHNTGVGKSLFMCHMAAQNLISGYNVLYITLEMAEERIAERIDANLMHVTMDELAEMPWETYKKKIDKIKAKTTGRLVIKEYPTSSASAANFRHLLNELKLKKGFLPDVIYIDYLSICASSRLKGANVNSYNYVKSIAEEVRGLATEFNVAIVSAIQTNREGLGNSDVELTNSSDSIGVPYSADLMFAVISTEEMEAMRQIMVKQLKNRYNDVSRHKRFVLGIDRARMKLYDAEESAQEDIMDDTPVMDNTKTGERLSTEKFRGFK